MSEEKLKTAVETMQKRFEAEVEMFRGETTLFLAAEKMPAAAAALRDEFGFDNLLDASAVDYWPETPDLGRFHVFYQLFSMQHYAMLRLRTRLDNASPRMPTLTGVYPAANWKEREIWDMFGITFEGHPDQRRILMPYDWEGHPLRKDYPLGYEEVQFTFNYDEINQRKPNAKGLR